MNTNVNNYIELLNDELDNRFPNTIRVIISGGDFIKDVVMGTEVLLTAEQR